MEFDHVTIRTADFDSTIGFLKQHFNMVVGPRPDFDFPGYWLYHNERPIIHLVQGEGVISLPESETIDHVAFRRTDSYSAFVQGLDEDLVPYLQFDIPQLEERRLFVQTPGNITIEVIFPEENNSAAA
jgi:catechol 2,3-dioxygenase-like lactoylglutathione lyase family enzyme